MILHFEYPYTVTVDHGYSILSSFANTSKHHLRHSKNLRYLPVQCPRSRRRFSLSIGLGRDLHIGPGLVSCTELQSPTLGFRAALMIVAAGGMMVQIRCRVLVPMSAANASLNELSAIYNDKNTPHRRGPPT